MSVMVTGGTGSLGYHLLNIITKHKGELLSFSENKVHPYRKVGHVKYLTGNLHDIKALKAVLSHYKPDEIYHLASQSSVLVSHQKPYETLMTNVLGTQNLLEAVRQTVPNSKVLLLSSSEVYGRGTGLLDVLHSETDQLKPLTPFAASKAAMEMIGTQFYEAYGLQVSIARPFLYTGPQHSRRFAIPDIASQLINIIDNHVEPILYTGNLDVSRDIIDGRDLARALVLIMNTSEKRKIYNICSGKARTIREVVEDMIELTGIEVDIRIDPRLERINDIPLLVGSPQKIMNETGWKPMIALEDSLNDLLTEMRVRIREGVAIDTAKPKKS
ncbi:MAG: GDP-mannose 4,6-dehydratase [Fibrobacterales bacterium]